MKVYKRTPEGQWAAFDEHSPLPRKLKTLLKAINGKAVEDVYVKNLGAFGDVGALLESLALAGLIFDRGRRPKEAAKPVEPAMAPDDRHAPVKIEQQARAPVDLQLPVQSPAPSLAPVSVQPAPVPAPVPQPSHIHVPDDVRPPRVDWRVLPELTEVSEAKPRAQPSPVASPPQLAESLLTRLAAATETSGRATRRPEPARMPPVLTEVHAMPGVGDTRGGDALVALSRAAARQGQSAAMAQAEQASNLITHEALLAANDEPADGSVSRRAVVRHAMELMTNFVLEHMPRQSSQVLPEIESLHSVEQWAELMDGYALFIAPTGERGQRHLVQLRRMLNEALAAADVGPKGWYA